MPYCWFMPIYFIKKTHTETDKTKDIALKEWSMLNMTYILEVNGYVVKTIFEGKGNNLCNVLYMDMWLIQNSGSTVLLCSSGASKRTILTIKNKKNWSNTDVTVTSISIWVHKQKDKRFDAFHISISLCVCVCFSFIVHLYEKSSDVDAVSIKTFVLFFCCALCYGLQLCCSELVIIFLLL